MKFSSGPILSLLATSALGAPAVLPAILPASTQGPAPIYPIGKSGGSNAKVVGRLFNIDGRVEYFAGN